MVYSPELGAVDISANGYGGGGGSTTGVLILILAETLAAAEIVTSVI